VLQWAQSQIAPDTALTDQAVGTYMQAAAQQFGLAQSTGNTWNNIGAPELATLNNNANAYASAPMQNVNAGQAEANSEQGSQAGISAAEQQLQGFGVNPNSGMYAELEQSQKAAAGASAAAAGTNASLATKAAGITQQQTANNANQQLLGQSTNAAAAGVGAVSGAENAELANTTTAANAQDAANPFLQTAQNITQEGTQSTSSGTSESTNSSASVGAQPLPNTFTSVRSPLVGASGGPIPAYAGGGQAIPTDPSATSGGFVSHALSPSGGKNTDDIPARLNADEFVMPRDVSKWYGQKTFQDMIKKARTAMGSPDQARPSIGPAKPMTEPGFAFGGGVGDFGAGADNFGGSSSSAIPTGSGTGGGYQGPPLSTATAAPGAGTPTMTPTAAGTAALGNTQSGGVQTAPYHVNSGIPFAGIPLTE
jgi:hypothetical protein